MIIDNSISKEDQRQYRQSLGQQVNTIEQEARMVLPGIQALFGFQLIAVFNPGFKAELSETSQILHLIALILVAISTILIIAPAAYHRQANHQISKHFVSLSNSLLAWAMVPLALGSCLDIYLVTRLIVRSTFWSIVIGCGVFFIYFWTWFIFPHIRGKKIKKLPTQQISESVTSAN